MNINKQTLLSEIVKENFHTASVFESFGIDYCCNGNRTIETACKEKNLDTEKIIEGLLKISKITNTEINFDEWELNKLIDYIIETHHAYVSKSLPVVTEHLRKVNNAHVENHPELTEIENTFLDVKNELEAHMFKEERMLFPYIKNLVNAKKGLSDFDYPPFGSVENPIRVMEREHESAGNALYRIRDLTNNYSIPEDACTTYKILLEELKEFENDLHIHVHLENNLLHPKAKILEKELINSVNLI